MPNGMTEHTDADAAGDLPTDPAARGDDTIAVLVPDAPDTPDAFDGPAQPSMVARVARRIVRRPVNWINSP